MQFSHKRVAVIFNPVGGSAKAGVIQKLKAHFAELGIELIELTTTPAPGSARELSAQAATMDVDLVIACGGDGTVCQSAEGLIGTGIPLAVFPAGTGNLFARTFYSNPEPSRLVAMVAAGQPQPLDMVSMTYRGEDGSEHKQLFLVAAGFGRISDAISGATPKMKRLFGKLVYVVRMARACMNPGPVRYVFTPYTQKPLPVKADTGRDEDRARPGNTGSIAVASAAQEYVAGTKFDVQAAAVFAINTVPPAMGSLSRGCNASDGLIDVVAITAGSFTRLLRTFSKFAQGRPDKADDYIRMRCPKLTIETSSPVTPNIDGDPGAPTRLIELTALPGAVQIIVS